MRKISATTALGTLAAAIVLTAPAALADGDSGSVNGTVTIAMRSVTVSVNSVNLNDCYPDGASWVTALHDHGADVSGPVDSLTTNGFCISPDITITNGQVPGIIGVEQGDGTPDSADAVGLDGTGTWALDTTDEPVEGGGSIPEGSYGAYTARIVANSDGSTSASPFLLQLDSAAQCDQSFDVPASSDLNSIVGGCTATAGQSNVERIGINGPASFSATDTATQYGFTTTWLAAPVGGR